MFKGKNDGFRPQKALALQAAFQSTQIRTQIGNTIMDFLDLQEPARYWSAAE